MSTWKWLVKEGRHLYSICSCSWSKDQTSCCTSLQWYSHSSASGQDGFSLSHHPGWKPPLLCPCSPTARQLWHSSHGGCCCTEDGRSKQLRWNLIIPETPEREDWQCFKITYLLIYIYIYIDLLLITPSRAELTIITLYAFWYAFDIQLDL